MKKSTKIIAKVAGFVGIFGGLGVAAYGAFKMKDSTNLNESENTESNVWEETINEENIVNEENNSYIEEVTEENKTNDEGQDL